MWSKEVTLSNVNDGLDRTQEMLPQRVPTQMEFRTGVAAVPETPPTTLRMRPELPTGQIVTSGHLKRPKLPLRHRLRNLRTGGRWSLFGAAVLLACWTLWAAQAPRGGVTNALANEILILMLILGVAAGLFGVSRLVGGIVLEKLLKRTRRSALLSHVAIGIFLTAAGVSLLPQIEWLINAWNEVRGMR